MEIASTAARIFGSLLADQSRASIKFHLVPFFFVALLLLLSSTTVAAINITAEDLVRSGVVEYETTLDVDDFTDSFVVSHVDLNALGLKKGGDALTRAGKFEGDIAGFAGANQRTFRSDPEGAARNAVRDVWHRWVDAEIPYTLSSRYGRYSRKVIASAMDEFHKKTCIRFVPRERSLHRDYIYIEPEDGCYSMVGRMGGRQPLSLDAGCMEVGIVVHELMHTVGFFHEQSRTDRDQYIRINWANIIPGASDQFDKYDSRTSSLLGAKYDYNSIMHYGPYAFSRNGRRTIEALKPGGENMGQREGFSNIDLYKLNKLYNCEEHSYGGSGEKPEPRPAVECVNKKWECYFWKWLNHCSSNKEFMFENCRKACNWCDEKKEFTTSRPSQPTVPKKCEDINGHCARWRKAGFCDRIGYKHFMLTTCPESCGKCATLSSELRPNVSPNEGVADDYDAVIKPIKLLTGCTDSDGFKTRCILYAKWGMCRGHNREFMQKVCSMSCGYCTKITM